MLIDFTSIIEVTLFTLAETTPHSNPIPVDLSKIQLEAPNITVLDVYDIAASIGKEFEAVIDRYGPDAVSTLMPKVISVLEELEDFAARFDSEGREVVTLKLAVHRLELEKVDRANDKCKNEKVVLFFFIPALLLVVSVFRDCLARQLLSLFTDGTIQEIQLMLRLKEVIDRQKVELRGLHRQLAQKNVDLDAVSFSVSAFLCAVDLSSLQGSILVFCYL
ncbi:hypothetical protein AHF37_10870 [Paragonimus kellicotti]|nr:hypothetical protein AHF37_10870 [Paragonimus kellicotti]